MKAITLETDKLLKGKRPLGSETFIFACHPGVSCFTRCCHNPAINLYPYDVLRLKNHLRVRSERFLEEYTKIGIQHNRYFPAVMLKMVGNTRKRCPFLCDTGCTVYDDRPDACRTYPLERVVSVTPLRNDFKEFFFLTPQAECLGHREDRQWTVQEWVADQGLEPYYEMNTLWAEMDVLYQSNPWGDRGLSGSKFKLAFIAAYNMDNFRELIFESDFFKSYHIPKEILAKIRNNDTELYKFGLNWAKLYVFGIKPPYLSAI